MRTRTGSWWLCVALTAVMFLCGSSLAVAAKKTVKEAEAKPLHFEKIERVKNGKFAYVTGTSVANGTRYVASNLLVTQPVIVTLKTDNPKDKIRLLVTKSEWNKADREASTGADGRAQVRFRTQGDFGLVVSGAGKPYRMAVWVGDEVKRPMPPAIVPKSAWKPVVAGKDSPK